MVRQRLIVLVVLLNLVILKVVADSQPGPPKRNEVAIHIKSAKSKVVSGDPIELLITITNNGQRSLFIGRDLPGMGSDATHIDFLVSDQRGHSPEGHTSSADRFTTNPESFANAVIKSWIALSPKSSYSFPVDMRGYFPEFLMKSGFYKIQAAYTSTGIRTQILNQRLVATDDDVKKLPFAAWEGSVESNELWIEIVTRSRVAQP